MHPNEHGQSTPRATEAEKALRKFVKEQKPAFATNSILPNTNYGTILANGEAVTTAKWVKSLYDGDVDYVNVIPPHKSQLYFQLASVADLNPQNGS
jgi:hypothetical protein